MTTISHTHTATLSVMSVYGPVSLDTKSLPPHTKLILKSLRCQDRQLPYYHYQQLQQYTPAWHAAVRGSIPRSDQAWHIRCKNLGLNIRGCVSLCLLDENLKESRWSLLSGVYARGGKSSHTGSKCVTCRGLRILPREGQLSKPLPC